jgi:hypothetical protein
MWAIVKINQKISTGRRSIPAKRRRFHSLLSQNGNSFNHQNKSKNQNSWKQNYRIERFHHTNQCANGRENESKLHTITHKRTLFKTLFLHISRQTESMGCSHSIPDPTDSTFAIIHHMNALLTRDLKVTSGHTFSVPQNAWKKDAWEKEPTAATVDSLHGIQFLWASDSKCLVKDRDGAVIAVMVASGQRSNRKVQIFGFDPAPDSNNTNSTAMKHDGHPLYERAKVRIHLHKGSITSQFDLQTPTDGIFVTEYFGNATSFSCKFVLTAGTEKKVVASLEEGEKLKNKQDYRTPWHCRTCPGVDAVLIACFVVGLDKLRDMFHEELRVSSSVPLGLPVPWDPNRQSGVILSM